MSLEIIISCLIGVLIGTGAIFAILFPKTKVSREIDRQIEQQNIAAKAELTAMEQRTNYLKQAYSEKYEEYHQLRQHLEDESRKAENQIKEYYDQTMQVYQEKLELALEKKRKEFQDASEEYQAEYLHTLSDATKDFQKQILIIQEEESAKRAALEILSQRLSAESATVEAAVNANKRAAEMEAQGDFYRLNLSEDDLEEIAELHKCVKHLRDPEPLNKVIWKVYYEKAYTDLIGRVVGSGIHCGIYKITNLKNGMCYVGQAVNIADRWKQHIKRGIGADTPTRNKLYPAMLENGVENFSFELIEECPREKLNEREDYWQEFFKAKEFGYSIK